MIINDKEMMILHYLITKGNIEQIYFGKSSKIKKIINKLRDKKLLIKLPNIGIDMRGKVLTITQLGEEIYDKQIEKFNI